MTSNSGSRAIWLEPGDAVPPDLNAWLRDSGFDTSRQIKSLVDADGWKWWIQDVDTAVATGE